MIQVAFSGSGLSKAQAMKVGLEAAQNLGASCPVNQGEPLQDTSGAGSLTALPLAYLGQMKGARGIE